MGKLQEMKQRTEAAKERLSNITVKGEAGGVTVIANGNREVKDVVIPEGMTDREEMQDMLVLAINKALENAKNVEESEMRGSMSDMLPGMGNMFGG